MRIISWKVLFLSIPITLVLFILSSLIFALIEVYCYKWFGTEKMAKADHFWKVVSVILTFSVMTGFKWSRGRLKVVKKPIVPWPVAIPTAFFLRLD